MADITRKTFLGGLGAAITAAVAVPAAGAKVARHRDVITQADLQRVLDLFDEINRRAASIRRRLEAGAQVAPGALGAMSDRWDDMPDADGPNKSISWLGLDIDSADRIREWGAELSAICAKGSDPRRMVYSA